MAGFEGQAGSGGGGFGGAGGVIGALWRGEGADVAGDWQYPGRFGCVVGGGALGICITGVFVQSCLRGPQGKTEKGVMQTFHRGMDE